MALGHQIMLVFMIIVGMAAAFYMGRFYQKIVDDEHNETK